MAVLPPIDCAEAALRCGTGLRAKLGQAYVNFLQPFQPFQSVSMLWLHRLERSRGLMIR
jgi:hypothetical protein